MYLNILESVSWFAKALKAMHFSRIPGFFFFFRAVRDNVYSMCDLLKWEAIVDGGAETLLVSG